MFISIATGDRKHPVLGFIEHFLFSYCHKESDVQAPPPAIIELIHSFKKSVCHITSM